MQILHSRSFAVAQYTVRAQISTQSLHHYSNLSPGLQAVARWLSSMYHWGSRGDSEVQPSAVNPRTLSANMELYPDPHYTERQ